MQVVRALKAGAEDLLKSMLRKELVDSIRAETLGLTVDTVKGPVRNILSRLGASDRTHAAMIEFKRGIIEM